MTLRIGVIGTGIMGSDHVKTLNAEISGAEVRAVSDVDVDRAKMVASQVPGAKAILSGEMLIESPDVDAIIIASSNATHAGYVTASIAAGKPVLCEKPLAASIAECEEILRLEQTTGLRMVQVGFMRRFDPGYVELRRRIASGEIGAPKLAHCAHRVVDVPADWTSEETVITAAVHEIDVMPWVFGREVVRVTWLSPTPLSTGGLRDPQIMILELEDGALVFDEVFAKAGYGYEIRCEILGEKGTIELAPSARVVARSDLKINLGLPQDWRGRFAEAYRRELQSWVSAISRWRSGETESAQDPIGGPDAWDGYRAAVISQALLVSMSSGAPEAVESMSLPELYRKSRPGSAI